MEQRDIAALMKGIAPVIRDAVSRAVQPLADRLVALEARAPEKGDKGDKGEDGFSLDDFDIVPMEDGRTIEMKFARDGTVHTYELQFQVPLYRGIFKDGETYQPGDVVTWGGSAHIAEKETSAKPETADGGWRMFVKRGRDGKDAK